MRVLSSQKATKDNFDYFLSYLLLDLIFFIYSLENESMQTIFNKIQFFSIFKILRYKEWLKQKTSIKTAGNDVNISFSFILGNIQRIFFPFLRLFFVMYLLSIMFIFSQTLMLRRIPLPPCPPLEGTNVMLGDFERVSAIDLAASNRLISI